MRVFVVALVQLAAGVGSSVQFDVAQLSLAGTTAVRFMVGNSHEFALSDAQVALSEERSN